MGIIPLSDIFLYAYFVSLTIHIIRNFCAIIDEKILHIALSSISSVSRRVFSSIFYALMRILRASLFCGDLGNPLRGIQNLL